MSCPQSNPCSCIGTYTPNDRPCPENDCFRLGHILIGDCDSVGPCGQTGTVSFSCFKDSCNSPKISSYKVISNSRPDLITVNSINESGMIFTTSNTAKGGERVEITFYGECRDLSDNCKTTSDYGTVVIYIKNLCKGILCNPYQTCNLCNGLCVDVVPEVNVTTGPQEVYIKL